jgi:FKBP-type peptidyl-prolyl cis-trans isomerase
MSLMLIGGTVGCKCQSEKATDNTANTAESSSATIEKLQINDIQEGSGRVAKAGDTVVVHYKGQFLNGDMFDSSYKHEDPFIFQLGAGQVIKGWDQGVVGMKEGGIRQLKIPSDLAYGERGAGQLIPPNTPLIFEIKLIEIQD